LENPGYKINNELIKMVIAEINRKNYDNLERTGLWIQIQMIKMNTIHP